MAKTTIPGLSFIPADNEAGEFEELTSFNGVSVKVPESYRYGNCHVRDDYERLGIIYQGNFGTVYKVRSRIGVIYALKKLKFSTDMLKNGMPISILREITVLKTLNHANIVNCHANVAGDKLESNFLLLDYCVTSLHELIEKKCDAVYEMDVVKYIMKQLFDGLGFIHKSLVVHRNISCRNLLFTECGTLKISGFRTARFYDKKKIMSPAVTELMYKAPEVLLKSKYGFPADVWSAGCVFGYLLLKKPLFTGDSELVVLKSIFDVLGTPSEYIWPGIDKILQKGTCDEKEIASQPYSDLSSLTTDLPHSSVQLLNVLIIMYPLQRFTASEVKSSAYFLENTPECSSEKMKSILEKAFSASELLDVSMQVDS